MMTQVGARITRALSMARDTQEGTGRNGPVREPEPPRRDGGLPLPGLKHWRLRRGLSQRQLALKADLTPDYLFKMESGRRGCKPEAAQRLSDLLEVDLQELRRRYDDTSETRTTPKPPRSRTTYRPVHQPA
jgi:DNA-binding XRE family transcriptional regulator